MRIEYEKSWPLSINCGVELLFIQYESFESTIVSKDLIITTPYIDNVFMARIKY